MLDRTSDIILAAVAAAAAALALFLWIPADSDTGMIETFRRQTFIGDAFLPGVAAAGMLLAGLAQLAISLRRPREPDRWQVFDSATAAFFASFTAITALSLALMFWAGPVLWDVLGDGSRGYRQMRGTAPWKHIGFVLGGICMVWGVTSMLEGRITAWRFALAAGFVLLLILLFDVPFDTLLLPPNGDW